MCDLVHAHLCRISFKNSSSRQTHHLRMASPRRHLHGRTGSAQHSMLQSTQPTSMMIAATYVVCRYTLSSGDFSMCAHDCNIKLRPASGCKITGGAKISSPCRASKFCKFAARCRCKAICIGRPWKDCSGLAVKLTAIKRCKTTAAPVLGVSNACLI